MKKSSILLISLLMQMVVVNTTFAQRDGPYAFEESYGARSALNYLPEGLTGKGVLVGVVDMGIDFNHINFLDPITQQTRVKFACSFDDGIYREARTPEAVAKLIPINNKNEHGTHVAGIAAGSYAADGWHGIATEAGLLLADENGKNFSITQSIKNVFAAADSLDMPLVLNLSIAPPSFNDGYLDEVDLLCEELTDYGTKPGRIVVVSSGNSGRELAYSEATIGAEGKARLIMESIIPVSDNLNECTMSFDFEALKSDSLDIRFFFYDTIAKKEVTEGITDIFDAPVDLNVIKNDLTVKVDSISPYAYYSLFSGPYKFGDKKNIVTGIEIAGVEGTELRFIRNLVSTDDEYFTPFHQVYGSPSAFALTPAVISVGNYDSHCEGTPLRQTSSFGVNKEGEKIPDVVAPGCGIISSSRFYNNEKFNFYGQRDVTMADGSTQTFTWLTTTGTSQAAPLVAGLCALMLEYDPTLTVNRVRELLHSTNDWNDDCDNALMGSGQAGHGILNTKALFEALMDPTAIDAIKDAAGSSDIYDLYGNRLKQVPAQGFYIGNGGKKYSKTNN